MIGFISNLKKTQFKLISEMSSRPIYGPNLVQVLLMKIRNKVTRRFLEQYHSFFHEHKTNFIKWLHSNTIDVVGLLITGEN